MHITNSVHSLALLTFLFLNPTTNALSDGPTQSPKRGLVYVPSTLHPSDDKIWTSSPSDLTWYYNYQASPSPALAENGLQFVPQMWGAPAAANDLTFLNTVKDLIKKGVNITHVLGFNEPDASANGGSGMKPVDAAYYWNRNIAPLRQLGVKLGAPAVTGAPTGLVWLQQFFVECNCTADFVPIHWYGNFGGLASHIGEYRAAFMNMTENNTIWITEWAMAGASLTDTDGFFRTALEYFDRIDYIERYSYFGAFRSDVSNVGPNAAMLTQDGLLTDIGAWYLGRSATGNVPSQQVQIQGAKPSAGGKSPRDRINRWSVAGFAGVAGVLGALAIV